MKNHHDTNPSLPPVILAPAGSRDSFLAAVAAGADAVYCGLKKFSARMAAKNFDLQELALLARLARSRGIAVHVALNSMITPSETGRAAEVIAAVCRQVQPEGLILQDLAVARLARTAGYRGQLHLSTLANAGFPAALQAARGQFGIDRVVLPRELSIDEIRQVADQCPAEMELEVFVHGALCYAVSGRCYWSSLLGGRSGLRGRCVQPCRRQYSTGSRRGRFFSCCDLSLDVLVKTLLTIPAVRIWKIEGRKKGPHYVYYVVKAYQLLRDMQTLVAEGSRRSEIKRAAMAYLEMALGRRGTHYRFLPQRPQSPIQLNEQTGSGLLVGRVRGGARPFLTPRIDLLKEDRLRVGYEDAPGHRTLLLGRSVPKGGRFDLSRASSGKKGAAGKGLPVFLIDRREKELTKEIRTLEKEMAHLTPDTTVAPQTVVPAPRAPRQKPPFRGRRGARDMIVSSTLRRSGRKGDTGLWLWGLDGNAGAKRRLSDITIWLPPVLWPAQEEEIRVRIHTAMEQGARQFVLNAPWQLGLFSSAAKKPRLLAGPYCNVANPPAIQELAAAGFAGVILSPELGEEDYLALPALSSLPLGMVLSAIWPLCISRIIGEGVTPDTPFTSPRGEKAWVSRQGGNYYLYPNWKYDLTAKKSLLEEAGFRLFVQIEERIPRGITMKPRKGEWNWNHGLK